ncbi:MAG TPA: GldG family protein, partial [Planctomycetota bacterium]|nr:GldG family protein [Planctomycetota bacterium]
MKGKHPVPGPAARERTSEHGVALAVTVHLLLLLVVLSEVVYLCSRHRLRFDLTADSLWSTTDSTRALLGRLDKRLVIEAYFSPKEKLPVSLRETRAVADNFLDEIVQLGRGRVVVQRFDPNADKAVADRCQRIGVKQVDLRSATSTSISVDRHWQGLRLMYGGSKQKVIAQFAPTSSFLAEAILTPAVKEVTTDQKRKIGYMEWPATAAGQQTPGGIGWNALRTNEGISKRYEFQNFKDEDGALLPADLETLFLFRPKDLSDRHKYVLDQFVVRGGTLVVFADAAEYAIGPQRVFQRMPFQVDAAGSTKPFGDMLLHYGIDWKQKVLADMALEVHTPRGQAFEYLAVPQMDNFGRQQFAWAAYPYFFHAKDVDWKQAADQLSKDARGQPDKELAETYRKLFVAGMPSDDFLFKTFKQVGRGPGFYWPTWVGLRQRAGGVLDLPQDVEGRVLLWSSPAVLVEDAPQTVNPLGHGSPQDRAAQHKKFYEKLQERLRAEPRQQAPLMVQVKGRFGSFFAGGPRPKRPSEIKEEEAAAAAKDKEKEAGVAPDSGQKPEDVGPVATKPVDAPKPPPEPEPLTKGDKPGRIVMIGDSDFIRDDLVRGDYHQAGGPYSILGETFFAQLLDWIAEDSDLVALQARVPVDRTLKLVEDEGTPNADARLQEQSLRSKTSWLRGLNVVLPAGLLAVFGLCV